jgi:hypothetical protein
VKGTVVGDPALHDWSKLHCLRIIAEAEPQAHASCGCLLPGGAESSEYRTWESRSIPQPSLNYTVMNYSAMSEGTENCGQNT